MWFGAAIIENSMEIPQKPKNDKLLMEMVSMG